MAQPFKKSIRKNNGLKKLIRVVTILIALVVLFLIASNFMFKYFENIPKEVHHLFSKTLFFISAIPPDEPNQVASMYHNSKLKVDSLFVYYKPAGANVTEAAWKK